MKNKFYYILLGVLMSFSFMESVFAAELDFTVTATPDATTIVKGKEVKITLNLKSDSPIEMCQFQVTADSTLEYVSMSTSNLWSVGQGTISNFTLENDVNNTEPLTNGKNVLEIKYKVNGDGKVTIKTEECTYVADASNTSSGTHEDVVVNLTAKDASADTTLSELNVTGGKLLTPITTPTENNFYAIELDSSTFGLSAKASNSDYDDDIVFKDASGNVISDPSNIKFAGDGGQKQMLMSIVVNNTTTYNLLVRYEQMELDNSLKSVTINGVNLNLEDNVYEYEYTIGKDVTSFDVAAVLSDSTNFKFGNDSNAPGNFSIKDVVDIIIVVEPVSSDIGASSVTYTIRVNKEGALTEEPNNNGNNNEPSTGGNTGNTGNSGSSNGSGNGSSNVGSNPSTGDISMFFMAIILIASLVGSIILYQKNLESYK